MRKSLKKKSEERVSAKVARLRREHSMATNKRDTKKKEQAPRTHKSFFPVMGKNVDFKMPEETCRENGHKLATLAQSPTKKIVHCQRLCGYYKVFNSGG